MTPIPAFVATPIDGVYTRRPTDDYAGPLPPCRRCPPYPRDRGVSRLTLDSGRFQMEHSRPEYRSVGHFRIVADRIELFNDAECADVSGSYRWRLADGELTFDDPQDPCGFEQRRKDLTALTWQSMDAVVGRPECQPPDQEAAVSGHWPIPSGC
ncbi:MAG: hypothetical protein M3472_05615 [Chloroflexota bacterium]|nr:hypothetical protein [Chloroflexota bacterium]